MYVEGVQGAQYIHTIFLSKVSVTEHKHEDSIARRNTRQLHHLSPARVPTLFPRQLERPRDLHTHLQYSRHKTICLYE